MKDASGDVLYVGKAKNLKKRVKNYFQKTDHAVKIKAMVKKIDDISYVIVDNESEALILENRFIKEYYPRYNTRLKDSKTYPYIKIDISEKFPRIVKTRQIYKDGAIYFGPYVQGKQFMDLMDIIKQHFGLRRCRTMSKTGPCLYYHLGACKAPCVKKISKEDYGQLVSDVIALLEGKYEDLVEVMISRMHVASEELRFEDAQRTKEQLSALNERLVSQRIEIFNQKKNVDLFVFIEHFNRLMFQVFRIKKGYLVQQFMHEVIVEQEDDLNEAISKAVVQFYSLHDDLPDSVFWESVEANHDLNYFLEQNKIKVYQKPSKDIRDLYEMLKKNSYFAVKRQMEHKTDIDYEAIADDLKLKLSLNKIPISIIGLDISHLGGKNIVASSVYFQEGVPQKDRYRKYNIKTVQYNDDFASMYELVTRIFAKLDKDLRPDLVVVDGGKGQLSSVMKAFADLGITDQDVCSLAKKEEIIYLPFNGDGVKLDDRDQGRRLFQMIRDEAHRFAINFQRKKRSFIK